MYLDVQRLIDFIENRIERYVECCPGTTILRMELTYLLPIIAHFPSWITLDFNMTHLFNRIHLFITKATRDFHLLSNERFEMTMPELDRVTFHLLQEIWLFKPDMVLFIRLYPKLVREFFIAPPIDQVLARYIESLVGYLELQLGYRADFVAPVKQLLEVVLGNVKFLKGYLSFILNNYNRDKSNEFYNFWDHVTVIVKKAACCVSLLCLVDELDEDMADCVSFMLIDLVHSIKPAKSDMIACVYVGGLTVLRSEIAFTRELDVFAANFVNFILGAPMMSKHNPGSYLVVYKDRVQKLQNLLRLLLVYILCSEIHNESLTIFDLVVNEFWFINSMDNREMNEELGKQFDRAVSRLVRDMEPIASKILQCTIKVQKPTVLPFSHVNSLGCIDFVSQNLLRLLNPMIDSIASVKHQIEVVLAEIQIFKPFLQGVVDQQDERKEVLDVCNHMTSLFLKVEYVLDMLVVEHSPVWNHHLDDVIEEIKLFKEIVEFVDISAEKKDVPSDCQTSKPSTPIIDEAVVGLEDQIETLMARLTGGGAERKIIPIIGMPGIGKTTLAKRIYNDRRTSDHFDIQAWCSVSPRHTASELVQDILLSIVDLSDDIYKSKEVNSPELVYRRLFGRRYLIVLDEVWNSQIIDELGRCFPDNQNGSRILFTSGQTYDNPSFDEPLLVRLLTPEESWELLQVKFNHLRFCTQEECRKPPIPNENYPAEVGKQIAGKCQGLPLAIVLVAGFLVNTEDNKDWLITAQEAFTSETIRDVGRELIELSYKHMPGYLRQCFLYFAAFPMSTEFPVSKLTWLWVSEGFVQKHEVRKPEEVAEDYLYDLMGRSLVMEVKRRSKGGPKSCRIHDYLYHFCRDRSIVEHFLPVASRFSRSSLETDFCLPRTLIYSSELGWHHSWSNNLPVDSLFRAVGQLVRVLDLGCIDIGNTFPREIETLVHLRFLSLQGGMTVIPPWIAKLWNLETFLVKGTNDKVALPDTFLSMTRLRHAHIDNCTFSDSNLSQLECLQTLSTPALSYNLGYKIRSFLFLQKLKCIFLESWCDFENLGSSCNRFPRLDFLNQLESLNVIYQGRVLQPCEFNFPSNLKKLTLSKFRLPWVEISAIAALPNLEVLKLLSQAFEGEQWNISDEEFPNLKFLKLGNLNIMLWNISEDAFPSLEHLVLQNCKQLVEIPSGFGYSCSLQKIEALLCGDSVSQSVRTIEEIQRDEMANNNFKVTIENPNKD